MYIQTILFAILFICAEYIAIGDSRYKDKRSKTLKIAAYIVAATSIGLILWHFPYDAPMQTIKPMCLGGAVSLMCLAPMSMSQAIQKVYNNQEKRDKDESRRKEQTDNA